MLSTVLRAMSIFVALAACALPAIISHTAGGWTHKYTSSFSIKDMPSLAGKVALVTGECAYQREKTQARVHVRARAHTHTHTHTHKHSGGLPMRVRACRAQTLT